jgi:hypothetical protein
MVHNGSTSKYVLDPDLAPDLTLKAEAKKKIEK